MTSWKNCFLQHGARFWKCLWDFFGLSKWKPGNSLAGAVYKAQKWKNGTKKVLDLRMPILHANKLHNSCHGGKSPTRDSPFWKKFSPLFYLEQMKTLKNFSKKLFTSKLKKKKREAKTKRSVWDQHKSSNSQAVQRVYVYRSVFFSDHCIKQIDSTLPRVCSVIDHRGHQNVVKHQ